MRNAEQRTRIDLLLSMEAFSQVDTTNSKTIASSCAVCAARAFADGCRRPPPLGSTNAPRSHVRSADLAAASSVIGTTDFDWTAWGWRANALDDLPLEVRATVGA